MTNKKDKSISPDGKWKVAFDANEGVTWTHLTEHGNRSKIKLDPELEKRMYGTWSVEEIVKSMKESYPEIWKN